MRINWWNVFFSALFVGLVFFALYYLGTMNRIPVGVSVFDFVLITLASMRLVRLVVYDSITVFLREMVAGHPKHSFVGTLNTLMNCPWCVGLWAGFMVSFFYFLTPYAWFFIFALAVAAVASVLQILVNLIGWGAERAKQEAQR